MDALRLAALDDDDLKILSAHVQDAVLHAGDIAYAPAEMRFALAMNRFVWEKPRGLLRRRNERRRAALSFDRVRAVRSTGIERDRPETVLSLLAINFVPGEPPAGTIELIFSGDAAIRLDVECVEARLADLGAAWDTQSRPRHGL